MKRYLLVILFSIFYILPCIAKELSLFDSEGKAIAYIVTDDDFTIYMWDGTPVAYLYPKMDQYSIYGFNGNHLGWLVDGIIRDHNGNAVGFIKNAVNMYTQYEPYKSYKQYKPYKSYREYEPYMPYLTNNWATMPLSLFLLQGNK
jgi:hypothetical protein